MDRMLSNSVGRLGELGLLERTRFLQGLTHHQVYDLLLDAHVLLMPSLYEGLPIALLESMACGCVPVVSRLPGITDHAIQDGESGLLVEVGDTAGFANAVETLYRNPSPVVSHERRGAYQGSVVLLGSGHGEVLPAADRRGPRRPVPASSLPQIPASIRPRRVLLEGLCP